MSDYISRNAAIEAMYKDAEAHPDHTFWTSQFEALMDIPAADVRPRWIPVTERLPDEDDEVLVVAVNDFNHDDRWVSIDWLYSGMWQQHEIVTHWMPLPEPPEELTGTDMRGGIRWDDAGNVIDWGITGPPGDVGKTEEGLV